jgi:hypothetical protein
MSVASFCRALHEATAPETGPGIVVLVANITSAQSLQPIHLAAVWRRTRTRSCGQKRSLASWTSRCKNGPARRQLPPAPKPSRRARTHRRDDLP